ncbi:hypothetical protein SS50377_20071 [Spironucleus salmonicida]|uniref:Uncharacterized protein n=1 Tax=Spironucleus salmonicida TaxID=348837 RepID=V6LXT2_9EUKA|nr:hypothetical protein SS50377_20071 [Spironucleus salmonicida]|eukprot:EST49360.1 hypothetical protein SS50377_10285 [Spironucleus salmonicida]
MNQQVLDYYRTFQLTTEHQSDIWDIIEQRAVSLDQTKFHWFVRLQSLIFVTDQIMKDQSTTLEAEFLATKLKGQIISLIQENKPNYQSPLIQLITKFILNAPAAIYTEQLTLLCYLQHNSFSEFLNILLYFPVDGGILGQLLDHFSESQTQQVLNNVQIYVNNSKFSEHLLSGQYNMQIAQIYHSQDMKQVEQLQDTYEEEGQTIVLLKQAENLVGSVEYNPIQQSSVYNKDLYNENLSLIKKIQEYEDTVRILQQDSPQNQVQQLQLELAQTRHAFDQLMNKYQNQKQYTQELEFKSKQYNDKILQFKQLFEQANQRYEDMKRVANERISQLRQGTGDSTELEAARQEITKLKSEKAQLSDITKKLISKLNNK